MVVPLCDPVTRGLTQKFEVEEIVGAGCTVGRLDSIKTKLKKPVLWSVVAAPRLNKSPSYLTWPLPGQLIQSLLLVLVEVRVCDSQGGVLHLQPGGLPGLLLHRSALLIAVDLASD